MNTTSKLIRHGVSQLVRANATMRRLANKSHSKKSRKMGLTPTHQETQTLLILPPLLRLLPKSNLNQKTHINLTPNIWLNKHERNWKDLV